MRFEKRHGIERIPFGSAEGSEAGGVEGINQHSPRVLRLLAFLRKKGGSKTVHVANAEVFRLETREQLLLGAASNQELRNEVVQLDGSVLSMLGNDATSVPTFTRDVAAKIHAGGTIENGNEAVRPTTVKRGKENPKGRECVAREVHRLKLNGNEEASTLQHTATMETKRQLIGEVVQIGESVLRLNGSVARTIDPEAFARVGARYVERGGNLVPPGVKNLFQGDAETKARLRDSLVDVGRGGNVLSDSPEVVVNFHAKKCSTE